MRLWSKWYRKIRKNKSKPNVENNLPCIKLEEKTNIRGEVMRKTDIERTYFTSLIWSILFLQNVDWVSTERQHIAAAKHEWEFNFRWIPREDCLCCSTRLKTKVIKVHYQSNSTFYVHTRCSLPTSSMSTSLSLGEFPFLYFTKNVCFQFSQLCRSVIKVK